jgi:hypothetical protein
VTPDEPISTSSSTLMIAEQAIGRREAVMLRSVKDLKGYT